MFGLAMIFSLFQGALSNSKRRSSCNIHLWRWQGSSGAWLSDKPTDEEFSTAILACKVCGYKPSKPIIADNGDDF